MVKPNIPSYLTLAGLAATSVSCGADNPLDVSHFFDITVDRVVVVPERNGPVTYDTISIEEYANNVDAHDGKFESRFYTSMESIEDALSGQEALLADAKAQAEANGWNAQSKNNLREIVGRRQLWYYLAFAQLTVKVCDNVQGADYDVDPWVADKAITELKQFRGLGRRAADTLSQYSEYLAIPNDETQPQFFSPKCSDQKFTTPTQADINVVTNRLEETLASASATYKAGDKSEEAKETLGDIVREELVMAAVGFAQLQTRFAINKPDPNQVAALTDAMRNASNTLQEYHAHTDVFDLRSRPSSIYKSLKKHGEAEDFAGKAKRPKKTRYHNMGFDGPITQNRTQAHLQAARLHGWKAKGKPKNSTHRQ